MNADHHRRSIRLKDFDYSQTGAYFVTACTQNRACLFGEIMEGEIRLNEPGRMVHMVWNALPGHFPRVALDMFVVMPNHVHGIVAIDDSAGSKSHGLPEIVRALKTYSSQRINAWRRTPGARVWQRGYYEHVVCNETDLNRLREYIYDNSTQWELDRLHPLNDLPDAPWKREP